MEDFEYVEDEFTSMDEVPCPYQSFAAVCPDGEMGPFQNRETAREAIAQWAGLATENGTVEEGDCACVVKCLDLIVADVTDGNKLKKRPFPTIVCLCGSTRFMEAWQQANLDETLAGRIVLSIGCNTKSDADLQRLGQLTAEKKAELDELHKRKIDLADEVLMLNVGGYLGESSRSELAYARDHGKKVRWLEPDKAID